ncbi:hypothetical protein SteCoe_21885 [Stentor coeruleus]|uniref:Uncharacterized protein n=1 Tax=Stentor coeruleus TaxID=5963 RepID=A0A1R2BNR5_9CILI|nr:hypothetical protein SteCoe_21885 [Stentor coeruleus]
MNIPEEGDVLKFPKGFKKTLQKKTSSTEDFCIPTCETFRENIERNSIKFQNSSYLDLQNPIDESKKYDTYHLKHIEYRDVFWQEYNCDKLVAKFSLEHKELLKTNASHLSYSLENCRERTEKGFFLFKYNFNNPSRSVVKFRLLEGFIEYFLNNKKRKRIPICLLHGIIYGALSSTFKNFKRKVDRKEGKIHKFCHCFSIVTEFRTYDFATVKDTDRMDICISLSYLITLNSQTPTSMPFDKRYLTLKTINYKIRSAARKKYMSSVELFMLAIILTFKEMGRQEEMEQVKGMLDLHFSGLSKFSRFIVRSVLPFIQYFDEEDDNKNYFRINILLGKRLNYIKNQIDKNTNNLVLVPKYSKAYAYLVPSSKSVFQSNRHEDPAFELLRQRVSKNTHAVSHHPTAIDGLF